MRTRDYRNRREGFRETNRIIVIAMEGRRTEPQYFDAFKTIRDSTLQLHPVPSNKDKSRPKEVLQRLQTYFRKNCQKKRGDEGWIVIDRDAWSESELNEVCRDAREEGFHVALSNPCFEFWLYLHLRDNCPFTDRHECQRRLAKVLPGYNPDSKGHLYDTQVLKSKVQDAIRRAKELDIHDHEPWQPRQGTRVYKLMEKLL